MLDEALDVVPHAFGWDIAGCRRGVHGGVDSAAGGEDRPTVSGDVVEREVGTALEVDGDDLVVETVVTHRRRNVVRALSVRGTRRHERER